MHSIFPASSGTFHFSKATFAYSKITFNEQITDLFVDFPLISIIKKNFDQKVLPFEIF